MPIATPESSKRLNLEDFETFGTWRWLSLSTPGTGRLYNPPPPLPPEIFLALISVRGSKRGRKYYVNEKFHWHHKESNPRPGEVPQLRHCMSLKM